ncbi:uncharacterized protein isoform X2 [Rhodnius prolixus]|uniref:uncharacterized protein isoform X2 n=1 Tax=Rhodnius prolixus TaxID=13249 RepID=UPI003D18BDC4
MFACILRQGQRFGCQQCNRYYKSKEGLYNHQKYECGKSPQFQCPQCPFKSKLKETATKCKLCLKYYPSLSSLRTHQTYYCGKDPQYKCSLCPYKSIRKNNLKRHLVTVHSQQEEFKFDFFKF